ncbi:MAG: response regulator [Sphingobacteriales bacterium JAD_PAG50586_3]|nr:MAG: response regulator [Sphingobacteriales bacterium JAD_PAG50586_3]
MKLEILLVDDDPTVIFMHKRLLAKSIPASNYVVANDGSQALEYIITNNSTDTNYLIFLDINMPVLDGWGFLDAIQEYDIAARCYIIMVTSSIDNYDKQKAEEYTQVIGFLRSPFNFKPA